jgi:hypothetical protein
MKKTTHKQLSFEPIYHRRLSQGKYIWIPSKATKGASLESFKVAAAEREEILVQGFSVVEINLESSVSDILNTSKEFGEAILANTNQDFKISFKLGEVT